MKKHNIRRFENRIQEMAKFCPVLRCFFLRDEKTKFRHTFLLNCSDFQMILLILQNSLLCYTD